MYSFALNDEVLLITKRGNSFNEPAQFSAGSIEYEAFKYLLGVNLRLCSHKGQTPIVDSPEGLFNHIHRNDKLEN